MAEIVVWAETTERAEAGETVVVAEVFCVAVGEAAGVATALSSVAVVPSSFAAVVPSSWTESHSRPDPSPEENGPTPSAALPPTLITPIDPTTSHVVRLLRFIPRPS